MKKILLLEKPRVREPIYTFVVSRQPDNFPTGSYRGSECNVEVEQCYSVLNGSASAYEKIRAINDLIGLIENFDFYDENLVPALISSLRVQDPELKERTLFALSRVVKIASIHDDELIPVFYGGIRNDSSNSCLWGLRTILSRRITLYPGLVSLLVEQFKEAPTISGETAAISAINAFLTQDSIPDQDALLLLAELPNGKKHLPKTRFLDNGKQYSVQEYIGNVIKQEAPELEGQIINAEGQILFNASAVRSEALSKLSECNEYNSDTKCNLIPVLSRVSRDKVTAVRANSIACTATYMQNSREIEGELYILLKVSVTDDNDLVRANSLEALQSLASDSSIVAEDMEGLFVERIKNETNQTAKSYALQGLIYLLNYQCTEDMALPELLIDYASDENCPEEIRALSLLAISKLLEWTQISSSKLKKVLIQCVNDDSPVIKSTALLAMAQEVRQRPIKEYLDIFIKYSRDENLSIRENALLGINHFLDVEHLNTLGLEDIARENFYSQNDSIRANSFYIFGKIINRVPKLNLMSDDLALLLNVAARGFYEESRAATFALAIITNRNLKMIKSPIQKDKIEILCRIFSNWLPVESDSCHVEIQKAYDLLRSKYQGWKRKVNIKNPTAKRLLGREEFFEASLEQMSTNLQQLYAALKSANEEINRLKTKTLSLELKLQNEKETRQRLQGTIDELLVKIYKLENPESETKRKISARVTLWLVERCFKDRGFHIPRMLNDIKAKLISGYVFKGPIQRIFGLSGEQAEDTTEGFDMFSSEE